MNHSLQFWKLPFFNVLLTNITHIKRLIKSIFILLKTFTRWSYCFPFIISYVTLIPSKILFNCLYYVEFFPQYIGIMFTYLVPLIFQGQGQYLKISFPFFKVNKGVNGFFCMLLRKI